MGGSARLEDICEAIIDCPHSTPVWTESGVIVLRNQNIRNGRLDLSQPSYTDEAHFVERTKRAKPVEGDLVITREAPMGEVCMIPAGLRCCLGQRMVLLRPDRAKVEPRYLLYALQSPAVQHEIGVNEGTGSTVSNLRIPLLKALSIPIRLLPEQRAIAHILGTLDDKIELNRRMNETLEAMARALFKSWFVDFDPVIDNALAAGNPIPPELAHKAARRQAFLARKKVSEHRSLGKRDRGEGKRRVKLPPLLLQRARELRKNQTDSERLLWGLLRARRFLGLKFRRQHPVPPYILDFYCPELKLAIEVDGGQHAQPEQRRKDRRRTAYLNEQGITVIRFWANEVLKETEAVLQAICHKVESLRPSPPAPLPRAGEGGAGALPESLRRLFPDRFVDSELGPIPEGWPVMALSETLEINPTRSLRKGQSAPYLDMANMPTSGHVPDVVIDRPFRSGTRFINGDTLVARITPCLENGKTAFVDFLKDGQVGWGSTEFIVLRPRKPLPKEFAYCLARSEDFREFAIQSMTGSSGRQRVPVGAFSQYMITLPPEPIARMFGKTVRPLFARASEAASECRTLAALRDTLLPRLISGELRVPEAEIFLEEAGV